MPESSFSLFSFTDAQKKGKPNPAQEEMCFELDICPDLLLAALALAAAAAFVALYFAILGAGKRRRRRRRELQLTSLEELQQPSLLFADETDFLTFLQSVIHEGMSVCLSAFP